jgi:hypothetical protein
VTFDIAGRIASPVDENALPGTAGTDQPRRVELSNDDDYGSNQ